MVSFKSMAKSCFLHLLENNCISQLFLERFIRLKSSSMSSPISSHYNLAIKIVLDDWKFFKYWKACLWWHFRSLISNVGWMIYLSSLHQCYPRDETSLLWLYPLLYLWCKVSRDREFTMYQCRQWLEFKNWIQEKAGNNSVWRFSCDGAFVSFL